MAFFNKSEDHNWGSITDLSKRIEKKNVKKKGGLLSNDKLNKQI